MNDQAIVSQAKLGESALAVEGMLVTILDTLGCSESESALSIITKHSGDQATLIKLKEILRRKST